MQIKVIKPGLASTIQDLGREGYYHLGIPPSGALDQYAMRAANFLVGNPENLAVLECTFLGPELLFEEDALVAITGAKMTPKVDNIEQALNTAFLIKAGQTLKFDFVKAGARIYLAIAGGFDVPNVLGSYSTYALGSLGGFHGRKLQANDILVTGKPSKLPPKHLYKELPEQLKVQLDQEKILRTVPGIYHHLLTPDAAEFFFASEWSVGSEADRTGYRFKGEKPLSFLPREQPFGAGSDPSNIVDACYPIGSIQVPSGVEPIVLLRDAVSGGGYAMIGTVISSDLDLIAQLQPNQKVQFRPVSLEDALSARKDYQNRLMQLRAHFHE